MAIIKITTNLYDNQDENRLYWLSDMLNLKGLTNAQIVALTPIVGDLVRNAEDEAFQWWDGTQWVVLGGGATVTNALSGTYLDGTTVKLGGELLANTNIPGGGFDLDLGTKTNKLGSLRIQHTTTFVSEGTDSTSYTDETYKTTIASQTTDGLVLLSSVYEYIPTLDVLTKSIRLDTRSGEQGITISDTYDDRGLAGEVLFDRDGSDEQYMQYGHVAPEFENLRTYLRARSVGGGSTLLSTDVISDRLIFIYNTGATTINLPAFPDVFGGRTYSFRNLSDSNVTIQADSGTLVEGLATLVLLPNEGVTLTMASFDNNYYILKADVPPVQSISTKIADYTLLATDFTVLCDTSSNDITITLPTALSMNGRIFCIKKIASTNQVIVDANGSETIDGSLTQVLTAQWTNLKIQSNGSNWFIL